MLARLDRVLVPVLLASVTGAVVLALLGIWSLLENDLFTHLLKSCVVLALASGFVLSATRLGGSDTRPSA